jgi:ABC-type amino acid transport substrate-binding protein
MPLRCHLLIGQPACGKTTHAKALALLLTAPGGIFALMVALTRLGLIALIALLSGCGASQQGAPPTADGKLAVCSYDAFAPISYGDGKGYEADLIRSIARQWGMEIEFRPISTFEGIWLLPGKKRTDGRACDVAIGGLTPTAERKRQGAVFSSVSARYSQSLLVRKSDYTSGEITGYPSFRTGEKIIGVVPGTTGAIYARQQAREAGVPPSAIRDYPSESELLPALENGEIGAIARGEIGNAYQQEKNPDLITIARRNFGDSFAISVDPGNPDLQSALAEAVERKTRNGVVSVAQWRRDPGLFDRQ